MMARKKLVMMMQEAGLPSAYQRIEYLEASGTQYIATNYIPSAGVNVRLEFAITQTYSGDKMFAGVTQNGNQCYMELYASQRWYCANAEKKYSSVMGMNNATIQAMLGNKHIFTMSSVETTVDISGVGSASPTDTVNEPTIPIYIFAWNNGGTAQYKHNCARIYDLQFSNGDSLSAHFIPCIRKSDNEPGMYDTVSKTFYTNSGTGTFIIPS